MAHELNDPAWDHVFSYHPMPVEIVRADGVWITDTHGRRFIDATGGPFAVSLGHGHPKLVEAIKSQLDDYAYAHPMLANRRRADLCAAIASVAPQGLSTSYLVSGGSEAVETALKIARQYHVARGAMGKAKIVSCYESYHGMTLATMALSGAPGTTRHYDPMLPKWPKIQQYSDYRKPAHLTRAEWGVECARALERTILYEGAETVAAFIATPHGCGPDYGLVAPVEYWREIRRICDENDVLFIADEVVTGFGRTGAWFGMENFGILPDLMTLAKGISSSYVPLGAVTISDKVNAPFKEGAYFVHGFTNGGNPLACAAGCATIDAIKSEGLLERVRHLGTRLFAFEQRLRAHPAVADVRGWGLFMVLELVDPDAEERAYYAPEREAERRFQETALDQGLVFYSTLYGPRRRPIMSRGLPMWISPPFTTTDSELDELLERLDRTLHVWGQSMAAQ